MLESPAAFAVISFYRQGEIYGLKAHARHEKRILIILVALCIGVTGIVSGVLFKVSVIDSKELSAMATDQQQSSFDIKAKRGTIYDRNNKVLAQSATVWDVIISPGDIEKTSLRTVSLYARE